MTALIDTARPLFKAAVDALCRELTEQLSAESKVTKVSVMNDREIIWPRIKISLSFYYDRALVYAESNGQQLLPCYPGYGYKPAGMALSQNHNSIASMLTELSGKYHVHLKEVAEALADQQPDRETLKPRQRVLMMQQLYIDEGFDAAAKMLPSGKYRLVITHEAIKTTLCEVEIA